MKCRKIFLETILCHLENFSQSFRKNFRYHFTWYRCLTKISYCLSVNHNPESRYVLCIGVKCSALLLHSLHWCYTWTALLPANQNGVSFTGASRRLEPVIKCCSFLSFFQSLVSRAPLSAVTKSHSNFTWGNRRHSRQDYNFWGNENFHNLYERLLHERKLKSGYLERHIYEQKTHVKRIQKEEIG